MLFVLGLPVNSFNAFDRLLGEKVDLLDVREVVVLRKVHT